MNGFILEFCNATYRKAQDVVSIYVLLSISLLFFFINKLKRFFVSMSVSFIKLSPRQVSRMHIRRGSWIRTSLNIPRSKHDEPCFSLLIMRVVICSKLWYYNYDLKFELSSPSSFYSDASIILLADQDIINLPRHMFSQQVALCCHFTCLPSFCWLTLWDVIRNLCCFT